MNLLRLIIATLLALGLLLPQPVIAQQPSPIANQVIQSGVPWRDTQGNTINAHGAGMLKVRDTYYMVGEVRDSAKSNHAVASDPQRFTSHYLGTNCYSSRDLVNWAYVGKIFDTQPGKGELTNTRIGERPKLLFNPTTKRYVLFLHAGTWDYTDNHTVVLSSDQPCGKYRFEDALRFEDNNVPAPISDFTVFQDGDDAYLLADDGLIYTLNNGYTRLVATIDVGCSSCESPAMFKRGDMVYLIYSQKSWWFSNDNLYYVAAAPEGPWAYIGTIAQQGTNTHNSQTTLVLPVQGSIGTTYVFMADRWCETCLQHSTYFWQPLLFEADGRLAVPNFEAWTLDVATGIWNAIEVTGASLDNEATAFKFSTAWAKDTACGTACSGGSARTSATKDAKVTIPFTGTRAQLYGIVGDDRGLAAVSVCDATGKACAGEELIDLYAPTRAGNTLLYVSPHVSDGRHTLAVRVTGQRNAMSRGIRVSVDRVLVGDAMRVRPDAASVPAAGASSKAPSVISTTFTPIPTKCNLLTNDSFESNATGWTLEGSATATATADNTARTGKRAMRLGTKSGGVSSVGIDMPTGTQVVIAGYYKTVGQINWVGAGIDFLGADGVEVGEAVMQLSTATDYAPFGLTAKMPADATQARLWVATTDGGTIWMDDVAMARAECLK